MSRPHVWCDPDWRANAACWCEPFVDRPDLPPPLAPIVFHRPDPGWLFREWGEQGPMIPVQQAEWREPDFYFEGVPVFADQIPGRAP